MITDHVACIQWLKLVELLSFIVVVTLPFSKGTSIFKFLFISNNGADVPELCLVVHSANMAQHVPLSSSLHFRRVS